MDAERYARLRELFLAAEELPADRQAEYVRVQAGDDAELLAEAMSLLAEHDPESARLEGERAVPVQPPASLPIDTQREYSPTRTADDRTWTRPKSPGEQTTHGDDAATDAPTEHRRRASQKTRHGAQRTHASPRHDDSTLPRSSPSLPIWARRTRESRRSNSRWLWLAALLPTALIGYWTYRQVQSSMNDSVRNELVGVADSVTLAAERFLEDKAQLVESWSRQPVVRTAIAELVELADERPPAEQLRTAKQSDAIHSQLKALSGDAGVQFLIYNESYIAIADAAESESWVGQPVPPSGAADLTRVMRGETVLFGPRRGLGLGEGDRRWSEDAGGGLGSSLDDLQTATAGSDAADSGESQAATSTGAADDPASGDATEPSPLMAIIVPVYGEGDRVIAAMLVRNFGLFAAFNRMFDDVAAAGGLDVYAVDSLGTMLTESRYATDLAHRSLLDLPADQLAARLRVADPGDPLTAESAAEIERAACPLTQSVADATRGDSDVRIAPYHNYAGRDVVGAWRWNPRWRIGVVIEREAAIAFAPTQIVRFSFLLLGSVLSITAFAAAAKIASRSARDHAAVHPLSRYEIVSELGSGGMGVVYRARHRQLGRDTALKLLRGDRHNKEDRLRFDREARLAASLSNPHSVMIYDYGRSEEGEAFCVMEFLRGLTLNEVVMRSGAQPFGRVLFIMSQICDALREAHGLNLLHRDIKPQNVMLSLDASVGDWAVVFDYGLAKPLQPDAGVYQTSETVWAGTPMYMAPERFREPSVMNPRSDIYSVGCVAYYLLSGRPPFIECDPESLFALIITQQPISIATHRDGEVPEGIDQWVMRCMAKSADERYDSIDELSREIDRLRADYPWTVEEAREWWRKFGND